MTSLAHVNIRTTDLEKSVAFYRDVLGLEPGPASTRPQSKDHVWMSDDEGRPCIHLQRTDTNAVTPGDLPGMHHLALACTDAPSWRAKLRSIGISFEERDFSAANLHQINLLDPDGVRLELLFEVA